MTVPGATYRLQLGADQDFAAAAELVGYLEDLGVTHLYLSPVLEAAAGSTHGYDVADPSRVSTALGGEDALAGLAERARAAGLGLVVDIVPNHVGTVAGNPLWEALLAEGPSGRAAATFDVDWEPPLPGAAGKVLLPVLGEQYGAVLHAGELRVERRENTWRLRYHDHDFPLSPPSQEAIERAGGGQALAGTPGAAATWARLHALLEAQHYRLIHWRAGHRLINYRRFFAIDALAAVRVEDPDVFEATHAKIIGLVRSGVIEGLRVDHPDGLRDPARYLARLAEETDGAWVVVEKIRERGEKLPDWPVAGTTGYEFANDVLGLFVDAAAAPGLAALDEAFGAPPEPYEAQAAAAKREKLASDLAADLRRIARRLWRVTQTHVEARDVDGEQCRQALADVVVGMDVYRPYVDPETGAATATDTAVISRAVARARERGGAPGFLYDLVEQVLSGAAGNDADHLEVLARFAQLSSAVMAKGVEDTVFYRYRRLLAVNEVGGDPADLGRSTGEFHAANLDRAARSGMVTTATHDTKRGEDVRLRMAALSEMVADWAKAAARWRVDNSALLVPTPAGPAPDPQTEHLLYQTLVGVWPLQERVGRELIARVQDYMTKAVREAGQRSSWTDPDETFESAVRAFVAAVLDGDRSPDFLVSMDDLAGRAAEIAMVSGLAQVLLRCTSPGVPDTYQGNELWDDSLVDPDNRRPVDFALRRRLLDELDAGADPGRLLAERRDGRVKLWVLSRALRARRDHASAVGSEGAYEPLEVTGRWAEHTVAFARVAPDGDALVVVVPRLPGRIMAGPGEDLPVGDMWEDTTLHLAAHHATGWRSMLTDEHHAAAATLALTDVLATLPVALLAVES